ncbi:MAG: hypothetical protein P1U61_06750 [Legionellaceae bacterium]|nr:hypothetical protein [Legionellaceae bacterium]
MPSSSKKNQPIIVRMVLEDRQAINNLLKHKRTEFESVIKRGVVAMLNAHDERRKIAKERAKYFEFITRRNKKNKAKFQAIADAAKNNTSSAPMGIGTATGIAFSAAGVAGTAIYNNAEERRQEKEAEQELHTAQFLHYLSSKNYEDIAQRVAEILSYRFQFLLFRLAAGEDGYFKLANFFVESMNTYAIDRLREHKGEEVKALIDAAIPPSADAFSYRDWPQVDFRNLRANFIIGKRKKLALDEEADALLKRCGPAVRAFLGGYKEHVDYTTSRIIPYKAYTILGALNHAPILSDDGRVISGLKIKNRQYEGLSGARKYPMILLSCDESTSDLGVTFGTTIAEKLDDAHIEALRRLVPHFFSYKANYELTPVPSSKPPVEIKTEDAALRYPNERSECPWTSTREERWHQRTQVIYNAAHLTSEEEEEVIAIEHYNKFKAMQAAGNTFDAEEARNSVIQMIQEAQNIQLTVYATEPKSEDQHKKQLEAAAIAKYSALAARDLMTCVITYGPSDDDYFTLTDKILTEGQSTLNVTRDLPLKESRMYQYALAASHAISTHANVAFSLDLFCQKNFELLLNILKKNNAFSSGDKFYYHEKEQQSRRIKKIRDDIKKRTEQATYHYELAKACAITHEAPSSLEFDDYLGSAPDESNEPVLSPLSTLETQKKLRAIELTEAMEQLNNKILDSKTLIEIIDLCAIETKKNHEALRVALSHETCSLTEDLVHQNIGKDEKRVVLMASEEACAQAAYSKNEKDELLRNETFWRRHSIWGDTITPALNAQKENALAARQTSQALLKRVKLSPHEELNTVGNAEVDAFFEQINAEVTLARLRFDGHRATLVQQKKPSPQYLSIQQQIQQALTHLDEKTQELSRSVKKTHAYHAEMAYERIKRRTDAVRKDSNLSQIAKQARKIRLHSEALEKIITNDINLIYFLEKKATFEVIEIEEAKESIDGLKEKLECFYKRHCDDSNGLKFADNLSNTTHLDDTLSSNASIMSNSAIERIDTLIIHLEEDNLLENSSDMLKEILLSFITNLEATPYLQAITPKEIQTKIVSVLQEIKEKITKNLEYLGDNWEIELVLTINLWLIEAVQKNEVVYLVDDFLELDEASIKMVQSELRASAESTERHSNMMMQIQSEPKSLALGQTKDDASADEKASDSSALAAVSNLVGSTSLNIRQLSNHQSSRLHKKSLVRNQSYQQRLSAAENLSHISADSDGSDSTGLTESSNDTDKTLSTEITSATEALERIKKIISKKSPALKSAIEGASRSIEEAYHAVYRTKNQLLDNAQRDINPTLDSWNLVSSTLAWSGRLTNTELRWLEKRQMDRRLSKGAHSDTGKSLVRMAYSLVLTYSHDSLEVRKRVVGELNKFDRPLQRVRKQLYDLDMISRQGGHSELPSLKKIKTYYEKLLSLVNEKIKQEEDKKNNMDTLRSSVLAQTMRIHFDEWKRKMYKPEEQSERLQALRAGREERLEMLNRENQLDKKDSQQPPAKHEETDLFIKDKQLLNKHRFYGSGAYNLEEEAANITIEDLEAMLENLQEKIDEMMKPYTSSKALGRSQSFYGGGFKVGHDSSSESRHPEGEESSSVLSPIRTGARTRDLSTFNF